MRPRSIIWFERTAYLWFALSLVNSYAVYARMRAAPADPSHAGPGIVFVIFLVSVAINGPLFWLIAYRANNIARWIWVTLTAIGFLGLLGIRGIIAYGGLSAAIALFLYALAAVSLWLLFRPDARDWFAGRRPIDPDVFS
jgi:hypothetical protein